MSYSSYALVQPEGNKLQVLLACHPETMSAGLKAFRSPQEMNADLALLQKHFVPPFGATWICVSEGGDVHPKKILDVVDDPEDAPLRRRRAISKNLPELPVEMWLEIIAKLPLQRRIAACQANPALHAACKQRGFLTVKPSDFMTVTARQAKQVYNQCDNKMLHLHNFARWMMYLRQGPLFHYADWKSITNSKELAALGIRWNPTPRD